MVGTLSRVVCVKISRFLVAAARYEAPDLEERCVVIQGPEDSKEGIREVSEEAEAEGIRCGMTAVQCQAMVPEVVVVPWAGAGELHTRQIEKGLHKLAPKVESAGDGVFFLAFQGLERLYGGEEDFLDAIAAWLTRAGWPFSLGVAGTRFGAFAAACCGGGRESIPSGGERPYLATLPLSVLPMSTELQERLLGLGIRTVGAFAELPAPSVEVRYGIEGIHFHLLARGEDRSLLCFTVPEESLRRSVEVRASTIAQLEPAVRQALGELMEEMRAKERSCASLKVLLRLEDDTWQHLDVTTARPTVQEKVFWELLRLGLSEHLLPSPVVEVDLEVTRQRQGVGEQGNLFDSPMAMDNKVHRKCVESATGWLRGLYGEKALLYPGLRDTHRPEGRRGELPISQRTKLPFAEGMSWVGEKSALSPALRILDPPQKVKVRMEGAQLAWFGWSGGHHGVRAMIGPQRLSGEWWREAFERDYFEVLTADSGLFWIFLDRNERQWFLQGIFD